MVLQDLIIFTMSLVDPLAFFLVFQLFYSISRAFSLIGWGNQIERAKDLPDYHENQSAKKLKKSGIYLHGVIGILLAVNITYVFMDEYYRIDYQNQSVKLSEEILSSIQTDPSQLQKMCQQTLR